MNREMYESMKTQLVVENIAIGSIEPSSSKSQVRQAGERQAHVESLIEEIESIGQQVPITIEEKPKNSDGTSHYRIVEGNHRYAAIKKLRKTTGDSRYAVIKAVRKKFKDDYDRLQYQIEANNHTGVSLKSSVADSVVVLKSFVFSDKPVSGAPPDIKRLHGSARLNITNPPAYAKMLKNAIKQFWPDYGYKKVNNIVKSFLKDPQLPGKFASFNADSVKSEFNEWVASTGESIGQVSSEGEELYSILSIKNNNHIDYGLIGQAFRHKTESPASKIHKNIAVIFWSDIAGKSFKDLDEHRKGMVEKINARNRSDILARGCKIIDEIYIAPQKRDGCEEHGFYKMPKTSKGAFSIKQIPDAGWNTTGVTSESIAA
jgi:hypothetical protein